MDELLYSLTVLAGAFKKELRLRWKSTWATSPRRVRLAKIDAKLPSHTYLKSTDQLMRAQASVLMQLHTGHILLNGFLHRIRKVDSPDCPACPGTHETVHHFLFECPAFTHAQHGLARATGQYLKSLRYILGNQDAFGPVMKFVRDLGWLKTTYGDLSRKT